MANVALTGLFLLRDAALMSGLMVLRYRNLKPVSLGRLFDFSGQDTKVTATKVSKANTAFQITLIVASMGAPVWDYVGSMPLQALWLATTITTFWSGAQYWQQRHTLHAVRPPPSLKKEVPKKTEGR